MDSLKQLEIKINSLRELVENFESKSHDEHDLAKVKLFRIISLNSIFLIIKY